MFDTSNKSSQSRTKFSGITLEQSLSYLSDLKVEEFKRIFGSIIICGRWSDKMVVKFPDIILG